MFCFNPVDTRFPFNVYSTTMRRQIDVETRSCVYREGDLILSHRQSLGKLSSFALKSKRSLNFNPLSSSIISIKLSCFVVTAFLERDITSIG